MVCPPWCPSCSCVLALECVFVSRMWPTISHDSAIPTQTFRTMQKHVVWISHGGARFRTIPDDSARLGDTLGFCVQSAAHDTARFRTIPHDAIFSAHFFASCKTLLRNPIPDSCARLCPANLCSDRFLCKVLSDLRHGMGALGHTRYLDQPVWPSMRHGMASCYHPPPCKHSPPTALTENGSAHNRSYRKVSHEQR